LVERLAENKKKILKLIARNPRLSKKAMAESLGISTTAVDKNLMYAAMASGNSAQPIYENAPCSLQTGCTYQHPCYTHVCWYVRRLLSYPSVRDHGCGNPLP
jgi:hypothetical protein